MMELILILVRREVGYLIERGHQYLSTLRILPLALLISYFIDILALASNSFLERTSNTRRKKDLVLAPLNPPSEWTSLT